MARPGANLTGLTLSVGYQLAGKRVELLKDIKPDLARLAVLNNPNQPASSPYLSEAEKAAESLVSQCGRSMRETRAICQPHSPRWSSGALTA